jgi:hypothetical protein
MEVGRIPWPEFNALKNAFRFGSWNFRSLRFSA